MFQMALVPIPPRAEFGQYHNLIAKLEREHHGYFTNYNAHEPSYVSQTVAKADPEADEEGYELPSSTAARAQAGDHSEGFSQWYCHDYEGDLSGCFIDAT